jgi:hypothetical protein
MFRTSGLEKCNWVGLVLGQESEEEQWRSQNFWL